MTSQKRRKLGEAVQETLDWMSSFGEDPEGGVSRFLYSPEWIDMQDALKEAFKKEKFVAKFDEVGNLFGRLEGRKHTEETILTGSHVDTVKNGGSYDGQYGIAAGFVAMKYLQETYGAPLRNIEVVSMAEEEGSRFPYTFWGSKNIVGLGREEEVKKLKDAEGISFDEAIKAAGFNYKEDPTSIREDIKSFVEVHVEQGNVLETEGKQVGIVENIVGQRRFTISVEGQANHAGTTPMGYRTDAMNASSRMIASINDLALEFGDPLVATVGNMTIEPNIVNVIPRKAEFSLDVRHTEKRALISFTNEMEAKLQEISEQVGTTLHIDMYMDEDPVPMDKDIVGIIQGQCEKSELNYKVMHSGAGHDSQIIATKIPSAMIFVPSRDGISHSPLEFTEIEDLGAGVEALIASLYELAYEE